MQNAHFILLLYIKSLPFANHREAVNGGIVSKQQEMEQRFFSLNIAGNQTRNRQSLKDRR